MNKKEAFSIQLDRWNQCIITGKSVTKEQAWEIIRRTDRFFSQGYEGNDETYIRAVKRMLNMPDRRWFDYTDEKLKNFRENWGVIDLNDLFNEWISCCWCTGVHGFCHPDGTIFFDDSIGKYPEIETTYNDLMKLGKEFPYLNMQCTYMNGEMDVNTEGIVTLHLHDQEVDFLDPVIKSYDNSGFAKKIRARKESAFSLADIQKMKDIFEKRNESTL